MRVARSGISATVPPASEVFVAVGRAGAAGAAGGVAHIACVDGPGWLAAAKLRRASAGHPPAARAGIHDPRFVLVLLAHDENLAATLPEHVRTQAAQLVGLGNAAAHAEPLTQADVMRAAQLAAQLIDEANPAAATRPAAMRDASEQAWAWSPERPDVVSGHRGLPDRWPVGRRTTRAFVVVLWVVTIVGAWPAAAWLVFAWRTGRQLERPSTAGVARFRRPVTRREWIRTSAVGVLGAWLFVAMTASSPLLGLVGLLAAAGAFVLFSDSHRHG